MKDIFVSPTTARDIADLNHAIRNAVLNISVVTESPQVVGEVKKIIDALNQFNATHSEGNNNKNSQKSIDSTLSNRAMLTKFMMWLDSGNHGYFLNGLREWRKTISYEEGSKKVNYKEVVEAFLNKS